MKCQISFPITFHSLHDPIHRLNIVYNKFKKHCLLFIENWKFGLVSMFKTFKYLSTNNIICFTFFQNVTSFFLLHIIYIHLTGYCICIGHCISTQSYELLSPIVVLLHCISKQAYLLGILFLTQF